MSKARCLGLVVLIALITIGAPRAMANYVTNASGSATCTSYSLTVSTIDLTIGHQYQMEFNLTFKSTAGTSIDVSNLVDFTATASSMTETFIEPLGPLSGNFSANGGYAAQGTVTLESSGSEAGIKIPALSCPASPPPPCNGTSVNGSNFNGTSVPAGHFVWFNANFTASGIPSTGATINFTNSAISFTDGSAKYNLAAPNAQITFSPTASCVSTTFNSITNTWVTTVPVSGDDEIFLSGLAWPIPAGGLAGGINPVDWQGSFNVSPNNSGIQIQWKWGAAAYSSFTTNYNALAVKAGHNKACGPSNGDHAGTPEGVNNTNEPWKSFVVGGTRGGGGSNWTGSWSNTDTVQLTCH